MDHSLVNHYFPHLSPRQQQQFAALNSCYRDWNARINVISRKDIDHLYLRHVLHSLAIARFISFKDGENVLDVGTGGGFPGIPLAILFPQTHFFLCDSIAKKIRVVHAIAKTLGLGNVSAAQIRAQDIQKQFDFVVSRAVAPLYDFVPWVWDKTAKGIICLKGGDLKEEIATSIQNIGMDKNQIEEISIYQWFKESFFEEKKIVFVRKSCRADTGVNLR